MINIENISNSHPTEVESINEYPSATYNTNQYSPEYNSIINYQNVYVLKHTRQCLRYKFQVTQNNASELRV